MGNDKRDMGQTIVEDAALTLHGMLAHKVAMVRAEDDNRVFT